MRKTFPLLRELLTRFHASWIAGAKSQEGENPNGGRTGRSALRTLCVDLDLLDLCPAVQFRQNRNHECSHRVLNNIVIWPILIDFSQSRDAPATEE
jgi:hypothetical protein